MIMFDGGGTIAEGAKVITTSMTKLHRGGTYKYIILICSIIINIVINLLSSDSSV